MTAKRLGDYEIIREIGKGGMGRVFLAKNIYLPAMIVVLKVLMDPAQKERFYREPAVLCKLDHKNICQIRTFFEYDGDLVIAMQYVEGKTLAERMLGENPLNLAQARQIFLQVLDGIDYAHAKGVYHHDLKPDNIMVDDQDQVKIIDFGIARQTIDVRLTATGQAVGTPLYMSPEQFVESDFKQFWLCDIYALGISLYEVCCGVPPFQSSNPYLLKEMHCSRKPPRPSSVNSSISPELEEVILKAVAKKPSNRFQSAREMRDALQAVSSLDLAVEETIEFPSGKRTKKGRTLALISALAVMIIALLVIFWPHPESHLSFSVLSQKIGQGGTFKEIDLMSLLPPDKARLVTKWNASGGRDLVVKIAADGIASVEKPADSWKGRETIWFIAVQRQGTQDSAMATFECEGQKLKVGNPPVLQLRAGEKMPINLNSFVVEPRDPDGTIRWTNSAPTGLVVQLNGQKATITPRQQWHGRDSITFTATNKDGASASLVATFESAPVPIEDTTSRLPATYGLKLQVLPPGCLIYDSGGNKFIDQVTTRGETGIYYFKVFHRSYPITSVEVAVNSRAVDTTIDLRTVYVGPATAKLGVAVMNGGGEPMDRIVLLNGFQTDHISTKGLMQLYPGEYQISFDEGKDLRVDSVEVNDQRSSMKKPVITLRDGSTTRVYFYVSEI
jgi:serine/threonine protein kinase